MERNLDLRIGLAEDESFAITVSEPESGLHTTFDFFFSPDEHPEFNNTIGDEIYSWLSLWFDEMQEENK